MAKSLTKSKKRGISKYRDPNYETMMGRKPGPMKVKREDTRKQVKERLKRYDGPDE